MFDKPVVRQIRDIDDESTQVGDKHLARFRLLFSADRTDTHSLTCGVATIDAEHPLPLHRHAHAEIYIGLVGEAHVEVDGKAYLLSEGSAIFIPGNHPHAVHTTSVARLLFIFAADSHDEVHYFYLEDL